jgi:hypothetical protein
MANILLAWWNAGELGGFDPMDTWGLEAAIQDEVITLFGFIVRSNGYPSAYRDRSEFEDLIRIWRPYLFAAQA